MCGSDRFCRTDSALQTVLEFVFVSHLELVAGYHCHIPSTTLYNINDDNNHFKMVLYSVSVILILQLDKIFDIFRKIKNSSIRYPIYYIGISTIFSIFQNIFRYLVDISCFSIIHVTL
jgi:hypothetical protein